MFTDDSVRCDGPIRPGPSLHEWAHEVDDDDARRAGPAGAGRRDPRPRRDDVPDPARAVGVPRLVPPPRCSPSLPDGVEVVVHDAPRRRRAGRRRTAASAVVARRATPSRSRVDVVVLALGHLDAEPGAGGAAHRRVRRAHTGSSYLPAGPHRRAGPLGARAGRRRDHARLRAGVHRPRRPRHRGARRPLRRRRRTARCATSRAVGSRCSTSARAAACRTGRSSTTGCRRRRPPLPRFLDDAGDRAPARPGRPLEFRRDVLPLVAQGGRLGVLPRAVPRPPGAHDAAVGRLRRRGTPTLDDRDGDRPPRRRGRARPRRPLRPRGARPAARRLPLRVGRRRSTSRAPATSPPTSPAAPTRPTAPTSARSWRCCSASAPSDGSAPRAGLTPRLARRGPRAAGGSASSCTTPADRRPPGCASCWPSPTPGSLRFIGADTTVTADADRGRFVARSASHPDEVVGRRARRRPHRRAVGQPHRPTRCCGASTSGARSSRRSWPTATGGRPTPARSCVTGPDLRLARRRRHGAPAPPRRRRVHQPPGGRRLRPAPHQRPGVPPERSGRPGRPRHAGIACNRCLPSPVAA